MRKLCAALLAMMLVLALTLPALSEDSGAAAEEVGPDGFLLTGEMVYEDPEGGLWRYNSPHLRIEIKRYYDVGENLTWTEAEIFTDGTDVFHMVPRDEEHWMTSQAFPADVAQRTGLIFAVNSDYAHLRLSNKTTAGIIIRDGKVYSKKTKKQGVNAFPNLDTLALFPDGDMRVFYSDEYTAQEYLDMGATDVLAFGPFLIRDGELNEEALKKYGKSKAPRTAVGMVEKGHYFAMMLEGRHPKSKGAGISFLAQKLYDRGCTVAMNLDGGQTATMVFMGKQIITVGKSSAKNASARRTSELLGIGYSEALQNDKK